MSPGNSSSIVTGDLPNRVPNWLSMSAPALPPSCTQLLQSPASTIRWCWCDLDEECRGPRPVRELGDPRAEVLLGRGWRLLRERGLGPTRDRGQQQRRGWDEAGPGMVVYILQSCQWEFHISQCHEALGPWLTRTSWLNRGRGSECCRMDSRSSRAKCCGVVVLLLRCCWLTVRSPSDPHLHIMLATVKTQHKGDRVTGYYNRFPATRGFYPPVTRGSVQGEAVTVNYLQGFLIKAGSAHTALPAVTRPCVSGRRDI